MPAPECARPSKPRISTENLKQHEAGDRTFTPDLARTRLERSQEQWDELVERSKLNATRVLFGPLVSVNEGQSCTPRSVFFCRRLLAATAY